MPPKRQGERWQFYYSQAIDADGKNKAWAESYTTAQVKREQEEAERMGKGGATGSEDEVDYLDELDAL